MLSYFNRIAVPRLVDITVFRDDKDATQFYAMPSAPRLARDLIMYARDVGTLPLEDLEVQRGRVAAS